MEVLELIDSLAPHVMSILALIVAFVKGKTKKTKSADEIKAKADKKYSAYVEKQYKKNGLGDVLVTTNKNDEVEV